MTGPSVCISTNYIQDEIYFAPLSKASLRHVLFSISLIVLIFIRLDSKLTITSVIKVQCCSLPLKDCIRAAWDKRYSRGEADYDTAGQRGWSNMHDPKR